MLKNKYVSLTPSLYNSRIMANSEECKSTAGTYKARGNNIIWCSPSKDDDTPYLCDWDSTPSSKGNLNTFTNYRYAVYYSPKEDTISISPSEYEKELIEIIYQIRKYKIESDEQIRKMVANAVSKKLGTEVKHVICSITNDTELESLEKILEPFDVDTFVKDYVSMFSGLEFLQSKTSREAPKDVQYNNVFEVDTLEIFDSDCVDIDRVLDYKTGEPINFKDPSEVAQRIEKDKKEDKAIKKEYADNYAAAMRLISDHLDELPSPLDKPLPSEPPPSKSSYLR